MASVDTLPRALNLPKSSLNKRQRAMRAAIGICDPRAWLHLARLVNYYNHTHVAPRRALHLGRGSAISPTASFANAANITFGNDAHIGAHCYLWAGTGPTGRITVGDTILLGPGVVITATSYCYNLGAPVTKQPLKEQSVSIGDDVWIGANAIILPGSRIGNGAIIAAGAVVKGTVPDGAVFAGVPARQVAERHVAEHIADG